MASKIGGCGRRKKMLEKEDPETPLLDRSDAAVKELIRSAKKRGYVTHDQINALLSSDEAKSEQIEDILAKLSEMGVSLEAELEEEVATREEPEEEAENELVEVQQRSVPAKSGAKEPAERTNDAGRMDLRDIRSVELLSREGETAIAKRIEAGREAMIAGLCESPLTFQAIIIWRDELNEGKVFLRDIIDLEATYAGPDAKAVPGVPGVVAPPAAPAGATPFPQVVPPQPAAPPSAPPAATPFTPRPQNADGEEQPEEAELGEGDIDDDPLENSLSLAAIDAELNPKVVECFDQIADTYKRLRR